ncbi:MAG: nitrile hydratase subunit alpha [Rhodospirillaceae bacterium]|nr:nitrile hydratase subunit alpha [Rhodospirillaceae bacterium]|tara:strand:- start:62372 stop:63028 length:657 start_codon:yes stop_codon:yes gene_type:complete
MAEERGTHEHDHDHDHDHDLTFQPNIEDSDPSRYELMTYAMRELLMERGHLTPEELRAAQEKVESLEKSDGAKVIAKAWTDPEFKQRLLDDGNSALAELDIDAGAAKMTVVENTDDVQNVVVCTLCSCYPRAVLGMPPDWYRSKSYRSRVIIEPRKVLSEFGTEVPDDMTVRVHDSLADLRYLVIPRRPEGTDDWTEEQLASIVTRDTMVGVSNPTAS